MKTTASLIILAALALLAAGCTSHNLTAAPPLPSSTPFSPSLTALLPTLTIRPVVISTSTPHPTVTPSPQPSPRASHLGQTPHDLSSTVLAGGLTSPDDLFLAADGSLYVSDVTAGVVSRIGPDGKLSRVVGGLSSPEGMVQLPDGSLIVAEQGKNRLVRFDPLTKQITPFVALTNPNGLLGVDGIALDTSRPDPPSVIIPDSPNGALLRASLDGKQVSTIASSFQRPTGAWVEQDGSILVADENAGELVRLRPDGSRAVLARATLADDVVEDGAGNIFVISISGGAVHWVQSSSGRDTILVRGLSSPQGLCFDRTGDLVVSESGRHQVTRIQIWPNG